MKAYRPYSPEQSYLLPPSPSEWLPKGHLAYFVLTLVKDLDLSAIERVVQAKDPRGERPYSPTMMTALLLYAYATGVFSSRRIERATVEDVACRVLAAGSQPHFTTVNQFRATHRQALADLFLQVLRACQSAGLVKLGHVAIDGTKMKANASKHKAKSYERMQKDDARLRGEVEALLARPRRSTRRGCAARAVIRRRSAVARATAKMAAAREALRRETAAARAATLREQATDLRRKAAQPTTPQKQQRAFETLAAKRDQQALDLDDRDDDERDPPAPGADADLPRNTPPATKTGEPKPEAQRNFTDPESRIMVRDGGFIQAYNAQIAVDEGHQIIFAAAVGNPAPAAEYFEPMFHRIVDQRDAVPARTTADSGYFSAANVSAAEHMGTGALHLRRKAPERRPAARLACAPAGLAREGRDESAPFHARRPCRLRAAQEHRRTGLRPDTIGARLPPDVVPGPVEEPL